MSKDNILPGSISGVDSAGRQQILQALEHLIQVFWSRDGRKNWEELWDNSISVWRTLKGIVFKEPPSIAVYLDYIQSQGQKHEYVQELESTFVKTFINTHGGVSAPLYHSCYHGEEQLLMQQPALEMQNRLQESGLEPQSPGEPLDHLCLELEYLYFLMSLYLQDPDPETAEEIADFSGNFMLPWIQEFMQRIPADTPGTAFFANTAAGMRDILEFLGKTS
ncbi:molecular chaperone TorD family protein [Desulfonatronospira sp.]|uniref:molecular chaperone TorD family protein n=1 Tax=Desulfonatronospira sp. TaxID=1962951 RepID=UPI0025BF1E2E|nr:molecular chaperone TorD family protein [Desulfonatronospira sp.]